MCFCVFEVVTFFQIFSQKVLYEFLASVHAILPPHLHLLLLITVSVFSFHLCYSPTPSASPSFGPRHNLARSTNNDNLHYAIFAPFIYLLPCMSKYFSRYPVLEYPRFCPPSV